LITSGGQYERILSQLTVFRDTVHAFSQRGLTNINKHSENFVKTLLNLTYGYDLINLNSKTANFKGIDLGDADEGLAFQITSDKKSDKVDDCLSKCIRYEQYKTYPRIKVFILTKKQTSYTITVTTTPHFYFNWKTDIIDFTDLLADIQNLPEFKIKLISDFVGRELDATLKDIEEDRKVFSALMDLTEDLRKSGMTKYFRFHASIELAEKISVARVHEALDKVLNAAALKTYLPTFNHAFRKTTQAEKIHFEFGVRSAGAVNDMYNSALEIKSGLISYEHNQYRDDSFVSSLSGQLIAVCALCFFAAGSYPQNSRVKVFYQMDTNAEVILTSAQSITLQQCFVNYKLISPSEAERLVDASDTDTLVELFRDIMHCFILKEDAHLKVEPFAHVDISHAKNMLHQMQKAFGLDIESSMFFN
jgi:hypothetical protein